MFGTQKDYAEHIGKSKQYVNKLVKLGKIPLRADGKVDFAEADFALSRVADPARQATFQEQPAPSLFSHTPEEKSSPTFADVKTAHQGYQAKLTKLQYEREIGKVVDKQQLEHALVGAGRTIRQKLDAIPALAGEVLALIHGGGGEIELRKFLKARVFELEETISEKLAEAGNGASNK